VGRESALALIVTVLIAGCSTSPRMEPIPRRTLAELSCRTSRGGLEVAVDPWTDAARVKRHFGMDLLSRQIVPFEVAFANAGAEGGFLLQPESATILDERGLQEIESASSGGVRASDFDPTVFLITYLGISQVFAAVYAVVAQDAYYDAQDIRRQMEKVQFIDRPLYRSDSNGGFFYLRFADMGDLQKAAAIRFRVKNVRSLEEKTVVVPLKSKRENL